MNWVMLCSLHLACGRGSSGRALDARRHRGAFVENGRMVLWFYISEKRKRKPRCFLQLERPRGPVLFEDDFPLPLKLSLEVVGAPCN